MDKIRIKGNLHYYFAKNSTIPSEIHDGEIVWKVNLIDADIRQYLEEHHHTRMLVVRTLPQWKVAEVCCLYWFDETNPLEIDHKVKHGILSERDIVNTVIVFYTTTRCRDSCKTWWHTLVMPRGDHFVANPYNLNSDKIGAGVEIKICPTCGGSFRQPVIEVLKKMIN